MGSRECLNQTRGPPSCASPGSCNSSLEAGCRRSCGRWVITKCHYGSAGRLFFILPASSAVSPLLISTSHFVIVTPSLCASSNLLRDRLHRRPTQLRGAGAVSFLSARRNFASASLRRGGAIVRTGHRGHHLIPTDFVVKEECII